MKYEIVSDADSCKLLWQQYSPQQTLWEEWDVACCFTPLDQYTLAFYLFEDGLLPLCQKDGKYYYFGEGYPEMKTFWFARDLFLSVIDILPPVRIHDMKTSLVVDYPEYFVSQDFRYHYPTQGKTMQDYLTALSSKHRKNLVSDMRKLDAVLTYELRNEVCYVEEFMEFNRKRFGSESDCTDEQFCQEVRDFFHVVALLGNIQTLVVKKEGVLVGVEVAVVYKNNYYVLNGGYDATLSNLGKFLIFKHLEQCFTLQCDDFDLLVGDTGWKELWNMHKEPCFTFEKKSHPNLYST